LTSFHFEKNLISFSHLQGKTALFRSMDFGRITPANSLKHFIYKAHLIRNVRNQGMGKA